MSDYKLTVASIYHPGWVTEHTPPEYAVPVPFLPLAAACLKEAGFDVGAKVLVEAEPGKLVITLGKEEGDCYDFART